ncbi:hypothetical protein [Alishewanella phage vB_AspM_Slicko01]|nr:hypothetical protein [Alishewanella phage vB_AspM_Slicko01]
MFKQYLDYVVGCLLRPSDDILTQDLTEEDEILDNNRLLRLLRTYKKDGTVGDLVFPCGKSLKALERPWLNNKKSESCIPEGLYAVALRNSPIVERTSKGKYKKGYEIVAVPDRTFIMFHIGNYVRNSDGCVLTGTDEGESNGIPAVWSSADAFDKFMSLMEKHKITHIHIEEQA